MKLWLNAIGYQAVWFCAVIGAGHGLAWPGVVAGLLFVAWQYATSPVRAIDRRLVAWALVAGIAIDSLMAGTGLAHYAAPWPSPRAAPVWILGVWVSFAMTLSHSLRWLHGRAWIACLLGLIGGPLAYLGAGRGWQAVVFDAPRWQGLAVLALMWAVALPALTRLAARGADPARAGASGGQGVSRSA